MNERGGIARKRAIELTARPRCGGEIGGKERLACEYRFGLGMEHGRRPRLLHKSKDQNITPIKPGTGSEKIRRSRESGDPGTCVIEMDSRFRENDGKRE